MSFLEKAKEKIPKRFHAEPDFKALVDTIRLNGFDSKEELVSYLNEEIKKIEEWVRKNQTTGGTIVKELRDKMIKLGTWQACKKYAEDYL